jgi:ABC-type lipoprotein release transport system permease subunit
MVGLTDGMSAELIENGTGLLVGQVQVHSETYLPERNMHRTMGGYEGMDIEGLLDRLDRHPDVSAVAPRLYGGGLVSAGDRTEAGLLLGIDPEREPQVTTLLGTMDEGRIPASGANELVVGAEMARQMDLALGDEIVLVVPAADGSMGNDLYTLVGIFKTGTPGIDASFAVLPIADLQFLMAMDPGRIHEVALNTTTRGRSSGPNWRRPSV